MLGNFFRSGQALINRDQSYPLHVLVGCSRWSAKIVRVHTSFPEHCGFEKRKKRILTNRRYFNKKNCQFGREEVYCHNKR